MPSRFAIAPSAGTIDPSEWRCVLAEKVCDHTSVGMIVERDNHVLLIERRKIPFGFAPPAGHEDGDSSSEAAAERELNEEVGLTVKSLRLILEGDRNNPCRRIGGTWHHWKVYRVEANGEIQSSQDETKQVLWTPRRQLIELGARTEAYLAGKISEAEWEQQPGLEVVWHWLLKDIGIL